MVADKTPNTTAIPISDLELAPAPVDKASGTFPSINANDVINIGRSRISDASIAASKAAIPAAVRTVAYSTIKMAFFAASPIMAKRPIWK